MYDIKETFRANSVPEALELLRAHPASIPGREKPYWKRAASF